MTKVFNRSVLRERRRELRRAETTAEARMWEALRSRRFLGLRFVRQFSVGIYILDFYCPQARLGIELDGTHHVDQRLQDEVRTSYLQAHEISILRFWNHEVLMDIQSVCDRIKCSLPSLYQREGRG